MTWHVGQQYMNIRYSYERSIDDNFVLSSSRNKNLYLFPVEK